MPTLPDQVIPPPPPPSGTEPRPAGAAPPQRAARRAARTAERRFPASEAPLHGVARIVHAAARVAARFPKLTIVLWVVLVVACVAGGAATGTTSITNEGGSSESAKADARIDRAGLGGLAQERILIATAWPAATTRVARELERRLAPLSTVAAIKSPLPAGGGVAAMRTPDGRSVMLNVAFRDDARASLTEQARPVQAAVRAAAAAHPEATITPSLDGAIGAAVDDVVASDLQRAETLSVPLTLIILILAFGAIVAASVPLVLGITAVAGAMGALAMISQVVPASDSTGSLVVLIGLAVGVDYSLFYVRREREERRAGRAPGAALSAASSSVGRAILVSGITVMVALAGLLLTGNPVFTSMGVGTITVVAIALIGSLTVLPAMLTLLGDRVEAGRLGLPGAKRRRARRTASRGAAMAPHGAAGRSSAPPVRGHRSAWAVIAHTVTGAPRRSLAAALALLIALAIPAASLKLGQGGMESLPKGVPAIDAAVAIEQAFPGSDDTADFVVSGEALNTPAARAGLHQLGRRALAATGGHGQIPVTVAKDAATAVVRVPLPDHGPTAGSHVVERLRRAISPQVATLVPGATSVGITGDAAGGLDFANQVKGAMPLVAGFVLGLAMLLLLMAFRSWRLALAVVGLNLMSVGAAYGVMTAVFQHTWAEGLLGFTSNGTITTWLPLLAFVILFGLSMDYSILVLERIREGRLAGLSPREAAAEGVTATASTVTSAAIVMVFVFAIFATLRLLEMKQLGVGLAAAILIDATIVRALALPAAVTLLGERAFPVKAPFRRAEVVCDDGAMARSGLNATGSRG